VTAKPSVVSPNAYPALKAITFASAIEGSFANLRRRNSIVPSVGRWYSQHINPSANMFFARSASRLVTSIALSASSVIVVSGTSCTWNSSSEPSVSGFAA
jgi:hypothetical protein